jgi:uncharacterized protein YbaR (Trm112 family)/SAM-dependent methyltransferase
MEIKQDIQIESGFWSTLVCPETRQPLVLKTLKVAEAEAKRTFIAREHAVNSRGELVAPIGITPTVMLRQDHEAAYPIVDGVPILLAPEMLVPAGVKRAVDLLLPRYAEAYEEMSHYNLAAAMEAERIKNTDAYQSIAKIYQAPQAVQVNFPYPAEIWLDAVYDSVTQMEAYEHLLPITGNQMAQLGGKGIHAVKFLLAGASAAWAITPMLGEIKCAIALAREFKVDGQLFGVVGIAEEIPLAAGVLDGIFSGGCLHHMQTDLALPEAARVLKSGGRFAANDPWRTPFYAIGTRIFGKREEGVYCQPLTKSRLAVLPVAFPTARYIQHGSIFRYPLLALSKFGIKSGLNFAYRMTKIDDALTSIIPGLRSWGSSVVVLGKK